MTHFGSPGWLVRHGARTALLESSSGTALSYLELARAVNDVSSALGGCKKALVACFIRADLRSVIDYLGALASGHAVILVDADDPVMPTTLRHYRPDLELRNGRVRRCALEADTPVHPELSVLLSTSGSTASPKMVRLSAHNLDVNSQQIVEALDITPEDRAVLGLPIHYSYGLSVLHSHLCAGASLLIPGAGLVQPAFWAAVRHHRGTSLAGVPVTFEILERLDFDRVAPDSLRTLTQAGGRMEPDRVRRFADLLEARNGRLHVMYGQTEATARIACLPPHLAKDRSETVGLPVPGGQIAIADDGEVLYFGDNVMLGYADQRGDCSLGDVMGHALATGDLGRIDPDGMLVITGRKTRVAKVCGLRIHLDELERWLARVGRVVAVQRGPHLTLVRVDQTVWSDEALLRIVAERLSLPATAIEIRHLATLPRTVNGKIDYPRLVETISRRAPNDK